MNRKHRFFFAAAVVAAPALAPAFLSAQAFTLPGGVGAVTLAWQYVDNTGHRLSDGFLRHAGQSLSQSVVFEAEYGVTDRLSATFGIPYVFAKYTGAQPPPSGLPVDRCGCWHSGFQDFSLAARYRLGTESLAVTPAVRYIWPSHDYPYKGEAVVGRNLDEFQVGLSAGARLGGALSNGSVQASYTYAFVEKVVDVSIDRSNAVFDVGYSLTRKLYLHGGANYQKTHGGLRIGSVTGHPFFLPGEYNTPQKFAQRDRIGRVNYWQAGGGLSYSLGPADLFAAYSKYVWGRDAHNGQIYTIGATWYFDLRK